MDLAMERNRVALPPVDKGYGIRLPPEKYCLTGVNWELVEGDELLIDDDSEDHDMEGDGPATIGAQEDGGEGEMDVDDSFGGGEGDMDNNMTDA